MDVPDENILESYIKLDCDESRKIKDLSSPYNDAKEINRAVGEFLGYLVNESLRKWEGFLIPFLVLMNQKILTLITKTTLNIYLMV